MMGGMDGREFGNGETFTVEWHTDDDPADVEVGVSGSGYARSGNITWTSVTGSFRALDGRCCDMHNRHCEPPSELCCAGCTEAAHDTFPIRHADGSRCVLDEDR